MKLLTIAVLAILTAGPALAGVPDPDCPNRRRSRTVQETVQDYRNRGVDIRPSEGWIYQGYNEYLGY